METSSASSGLRAACNICNKREEIRSGQNSRHLLTPIVFPRRPLFLPNLNLNLFSFLLFSFLLFFFFSLETTFFSPNNEDECSRPFLLTARTNKGRTHSAWRRRKRRLRLYTVHCRLYMAHYAQCHSPTAPLHLSCGPLPSRSPTRKLPHRLPKQLSPD